MRLAGALAVIAVAAICRGAGAAGEADPEADFVAELPEFVDGSLGNLTMYSGYLTVNEDPKRELFYTFYEAEVPEPSTAPLFVWLSPGPGCSSVGMGGFRGPGPFAFEPYAGPAVRNVSDLVLNRNLGSWTSFANLLFIDSPVPTGFSKSSKPELDSFWGDANTTNDNLEALFSFFDKFPGFAKQRVFLAGQGYAGHTAPLLAKAILAHNAQLPANDTSGRVNLVGVAVGNPWANPARDNQAAVQLWYDQGLVSHATYQGLLSNCDMNATALWLTQGESNVTGPCETARNAALREAYALDLWNLGAPKCVLKPPVNISALGPAGWLPLEDGIDAAGPPPVQRQPNLRQRPGGVPQVFYDPCAMWRVTDYMNQAAVQEALHVIQPGEQPREWQACDAGAVGYSLDSLLTSMVPVYQELANSSVRLLVYSGTADGVMTTAGTRAWIDALGLPVDGPRRFWSDALAWREPAGFLDYYKGLTFASVQGAGHNAGYDKPIKVLQLMRAFANNRLKTNPLPLLA